MKKKLSQLPQHSFRHFQENAGFFDAIMWMHGKLLARKFLNSLLIEWWWVDIGKWLQRCLDCLISLGFLWQFLDRGLNCVFLKTFSIFSSACTLWIAVAHQRGLKCRIGKQLLRRLYYYLLDSYLMPTTIIVAVTGRFFVGSHHKWLSSIHC